MGFDDASERDPAPALSVPQSSIVGILGIVGGLALVVRAHILEDSCTEVNRCTPAELINDEGLPLVESSP